jgi:hypothetical protein
VSRTDRTIRTIAATTIAAGLGILLAGCGFVGAAQKSDVKPGGFVLIGRAEVTVTASGLTVAPAAGEPCVAPTAFADVAENTQVTVTNSAGKTVATGALGSGLYVAANAGFVCEFPFAIRAVPDGSDTYDVAIGNRPDQTFQATALRDNTPAIISFGPSTG